MTPPAWKPLLDAALAAHRDTPEGRYAQLSTVRGDGGPAARTVVVRGFTGPDATRPTATTDARSAKAAELAVDTRAELCWWFGKTREQFRLRGTARVVTEGDDPDRDAAWHALPPHVRATFLGPEPGSPFDDAKPAEAPDLDRPPASFGLLVLDPDAVDHLSLATDPHTRTLHARGAVGWSSRRVNP